MGEEAPAGRGLSIATVKDWLLALRGVAAVKKWFDWFSDRLKKFPKRVENWSLGKLAVAVLGIFGVLLLVYYALSGHFGAGPVKTGEIPLWLQSIGIAARIFQATATGLAFIVGGLFAYFKFFKEEPYSPRMQPAISAAVSRERELIFIKATAEMTNNGQRSVHIDLSETRIGISTRKAGVYGWNPSVVEEVFTGNNHVSPGETIGDQVWMEIPDNDDVAIQLELRVTRRYEEERGKFWGWIARDIVNLAED